MKKFILLASAAVAIAAFMFTAACAKADGPGDVVEKALAMYKAKDYAGFNGMLTHTVNDFNPETTEKSETVFDMFSNFEYEILGENINEGIAEVTVSVTSVAIRDLVSEYVTVMMNLQLSGELPEDQDEMDIAGNSLFDRMITDPDLERHTETVVIQLEKYGDEWKIITTGSHGRDFVNAMTCFQYGASGSDNRQ